MDSSIQAAELDYRIAIEETALVALQQDQARLFSKLELALADHQVAVEKVRRLANFIIFFPNVSSAILDVLKNCEANKFAYLIPY